MSKICTRCSTVNEDKYVFCKNCGTPLENTKNNNSRYNSPEYNSSEFTPPVIDSFEDASSDEMAIFVGKNSFKILQKFSRMEMSGSKISWCWPAAILTFMFGLFGGAIWFFYRKMYKPAIAVMLAACLLLGVRTALLFGPSQQIADITHQAALNLPDDSSEWPEYFQEYIAQIANISKLGNAPIASFLEDAENYLGAVLLGLFSLYIYKKHAINKIKNYKERNINGVYYNYGLATAGGTSGGMVVLAVAITVLITNFATSIPFIIYFM